MTTPLLITSLILAAIFLFAGSPKVLALPFAAKQAEHLGISVSNYRLIGLAEYAGAAGLLVGLWWPPIGVLAAAGLAVLMFGAAIAHLRVKDPVLMAVPAVVLGVAVVGVLVLRLAA